MRQIRWFSLIFVITIAVRGSLPTSLNATAQYCKNILVSFLFRWYQQKLHTTDGLRYCNNEIISQNSTPPIDRINRNGLTNPTELKVAYRSRFYRLTCQSSSSRIWKSMLESKHVFVHYNTTYKELLPLENLRRRDYMPLALLISIITNCCLQNAAYITYK